MSGSLTLTLAAPLPSQVCTLTTHATLRLGSLISESTTQLRVRKTLHTATPAGGFIFKAETLARFQTPTQGSARLTAELAPLLEKLVLEIDATGRIVRVVNKPELRRQWAALRPQLRTTYRHDPDVPAALLDQLGQVLDGDDALEEMLASSLEYGLLFPVLYGQPLSRQMPLAGLARLPGFIGELDLPLRTEARPELVTPPAGVSATIEVAGELDAAHYRAAEARKALCALTDQPRLDTRVAVLHHERYTFGSQHEVVEATRHTRAEVQGIMGRQVTVLLHTRDS